MKFYLMRHGNTEYNGQGLLLGSTDASLLDSHDPDILRWSGYLNGVSIDKVIHSGMKRTKTTAELIAELINENSNHDILIESDDRIRELNFGDWELKSYDWLYQNQPELFSQWIEDPYKNSPLSGETLNQLKERVTSFFDYLSEKYTGEESILVVTHGGPIRLLWSLLDNVSFYEKKVLPASLYCLDWDKKTIKEVEVG